MPGHLLRRAHQRSYEIFTRHVGDRATRQQVAVLLTLGQRPGAAQSDLVTATGMDKSTLKELIGRMVVRGLVVRERDPGDNRAWQLRLAPAGQSLLDDVMPRVRATQRDILAPLAEAERALFMHMLRTLTGLEPPTEP